MIRVLLADDQALVRGGFRVILESQEDIDVVGEAGDGKEAIRLAAELRPDVILMDIRMPNVDGLEATRRIAATPGAPRIAMLTTFDADEHVYEAMRVGASGFLLKDLRPEDLAHAVRTVAAGMARYNPMSYHDGSVWPHDNAIVAAGLARYGFMTEALRILSATFDLSQAVDLYRLPELICGFHRRSGDSPTLYPVACAPQAWSAGAVYLLLQACLGVRADALAKR